MQARPTRARAEEEGAKGYTLFEGGGNGSFHIHQALHPSLVDEFRIIKLEVIVLESDIAERISTRLVNEYFVEQPGIVTLSEVEVFRAQKF